MLSIPVSMAWLEDGRRKKNAEKKKVTLKSFLLFPTCMLDGSGGDVASADESRSFPDAPRKSSNVNQYISICDVYHLLIHRSLLLICIKYDVRISMPAKVGQDIVGQHFIVNQQSDILQFGLSTKITSKARK